VAAAATRDAGALTPPVDAWFDCPMQPVSNTTVAPTTTTPDAKEPLVGGGVQGAVGDFIRAAGAGYATAAAQEAVAVDKASIHPFEALGTATGLLRDKTAHVKGVNKATSILHTVGGFAMLILTSNVSGTLRAPGDTAQDLANHVADAIDGKQTATGWSLGWGVRTPEGEDAAAPRSDIGSALAQAGVQ
jgi:hypothetical protein